MPVQSNAILETGVLGSDKAMLDALKLTENEAAKILGRTRQSLYQAGLASRMNYFKKNDLQSLIFEAKGRNRGLALGPVIDYIRSTRGEAVAEAVRAVSAHGADDVDMTGYSDLWVVLPDVSWLENQHPDSMKQVIELGGHADVKMHYFTASSMDKGLLTATLKTAGVEGAEITAQDWMGAIPPVIIGDPHTRAHIYLFSNGRFASNDWYGGKKLVLLIRNLVGNGMEMKA